MTTESERSAVLPTERSAPQRIVQALLTRLGAIAIGIAAGLTAWKYFLWAWELESEMAATVGLIVAVLSWIWDPPTTGSKWGREAALIVLQLFLSVLVAAPAGGIVEGLYDEYVTTGPTAEVWGVPIFVVIFAILRATGIGRKQFGLGISEEWAAKVSAEEAPREVITLLRKRAQRLRVSANWLLAMIVAALIVGAFVFVFAGRQASREANLRADTLRARIELIGARERSLERRIEAAEDLAHSDVGRTIDIEESKKQLEALRSEKADLLKTADEFAKEQSRSEAGIDKTIYFVSSLSTKTGVVLLLVFLVRILTAQYRYNIRLASFLSSRADAIQLLPARGGDFERLVAILNPEGIDYAEGAKGEPGHLALYEKVLEGVTKAMDRGRVAVDKA
jgi:hypothetical protein